MVYGKRKSHPKARELYRKLVARYGQLSQESRLNAAFFEEFIGNAKAAEGNSDGAIEAFGRALQIFKETFGEKHKKVADVYQAIGDHYHKTLKLEAAAQHYQLAASCLVDGFNDLNMLSNPDSSHLVLDKLELMKILTKKSSVLSAMHEMESNDKILLGAYNASKLAVFLIDYLRKLMIDDKSKLILSGQVPPVYEQSIQLSYQLYQITKQEQYLKHIYWVMERNKSYLLNHSILETQSKGFSNIPDTLLLMESQLKSNLAFYEKQLYHQSIATDGVDSIKLKNLSAQIFDLKRALQAFQDNLALNYPMYTGLMRTIQSDFLAALQQELLKPGDLIIEYFLGKSHIYGLAISNRGLWVHTTPMPGDLQAEVEQLSTGIQNKQTTVYLQSALYFYQNLLAPFLEKKEFEKPDNLIIVPDGILGYIPFDLLLPGYNSNPDLKQLNYLIKDYTISYQYSVALMHLESQKKHKIQSNPFVGYAPSFGVDAELAAASRGVSQQLLLPELEPLPQAEQEIVAAASILGGEIFIGPRATKSSFKKMSKDAAIIHVASHTLINNENPLYSQLVFAPESKSGEDYLLHTYELYNLDLNASLVSLSACNTGVGKFYEGEGIMSLARGFMYAGVPSVVMSLWSVSDFATEKIMSAFYRNLSQGKAKDEALRAAKLEYLEEADNNGAHPYYWGGLVLLGNAEPIELGVPFPQWWLYAIIGALALLVGMVIVRRK